MTDRTNEPATSGTIDDVEEIEPASKRSDEGQTAHGGDVAGPSSDQAGKPLAPQTGEPIEHSH